MAILLKTCITSHVFKKQMACISPLLYIFLFYLTRNGDII